MKILICYIDSCKVIFSVNIHRNLFGVFVIFSERGLTQLFAIDSLKRRKKIVAHAQKSLTFDA